MLLNAAKSLIQKIPGLGELNPGFWDWKNARHPGINSLLVSAPGALDNRVCISLSYQDFFTKNIVHWEAVYWWEAWHWCWVYYVDILQKKYANNNNAHLNNLSDFMLKISTKLSNCLVWMFSHCACTMHILNILKVQYRAQRYLPTYHLTMTYTLIFETKKNRVYLGLYALVAKKTLRPNHNTKYQWNRQITFAVILLTEWETDKHHWSH